MTERVSHTIEPLDILSLVTPEDREGVERQYYAVDPERVFPPTIAHIRDRVERNVVPGRYVDVGGEIRTNPLWDLFRKTQQVQPQTWDHCLTPREDYPQRAREARAFALNLVRLWFTEVLHQQTDYAPMGVHILKSERFRS